MGSILIGTRQPLPILREEIELEFLRTNLKGAVLSLKDHQTGKYGFLDLTILPDRNERIKNEQINEAVTKLIRYLLTGIVAQDILERVARSEYPFATKEEIRSVVDTSRRILAEKDDPSLNQTIQQRVKEFLANHQYINLEGFLRFRLKEYADHLHEVTEQALEKFLAEKEYREFIRLLRYFVDNQEPRVGEVHVVVYSQEFFRLLDEEGNPLEPDYLQGILGGLSNVELNYEDLLLSALITLAPRRIYLHHPGTLEITDTIQQVFFERVTLCQDCDLCRSCFGPTPVKAKEPLNKTH